MSLSLRCFLLFLIGIITICMAALGVALFMIGWGLSIMIPHLLHP